MPDKRKATFQPYDMDTAAGTNNSGVLMFGYALEDTDTVSSIISGGDDGGREAPVFNAQDSVLWNNFRDCFRSEITQMYRSLRTSRALTYNDIIERRRAHQSYWPEAMFNEDQYEKHLVPLIDPVTVDDTTGELIRTDRYLTMIQGSKEEQFKWWLYNRFRYMDSKFVTGDAANNIISMRVFNSGTLTLTPAIDLYVGVSFGGGTTVALKRTTANVSQSFTYQAETGVTEMETWIYSGDLITDLGDLSVFYGNEFDLSKATRLRRLQIGSDTEGYSNANLVTLDMRNMGLLEYVDIRNCPNLAIPINLEGSPRLEEAYFEGTSITGIDLAEGGSIETLHLPDTITTLTLINLSKLTDFQCESLENVSRLMLANIDPDVVDPVEALNSIMANSQVNIQGMYLEMDDADDIEDFLDLLDTMQGVSRERSANGTWLYHDYDTAQVSGEIHTDALTGEQIASYNSRYPYIRVRADYVESTLTYMSYDNTTVLKTVTCLNGVPQESSPTGPSKPNSSDGHYTYTFVGWNRSADAETGDPSAITDVIADRTVYPAYSKTVRTYTVTWKNGTTTIRTDSNVAWGTTPTWGQAMPTNSDSQTATGWDYDLNTPITGNTTINATYKPMYTHTFVRASTDGGGTLYTVRVEEGQTVTYGGSTPTTTQGSATDYPFEGWNPVPGTSTANTTYTAVFGSPVEDAEITDSWDTIIANIDNGTYKTVYKIGNYKPLNLGTEGTINMQIVAFDSDVLASGGYAPITFVGKELLATTQKINSEASTSGGWESSEMRSYLNDTILPLIPSNVAARLQRVSKVQSIYTNAVVKDGQTTTDKLWIPGHREIFNTTDSETTGPVYNKIYKDTSSRIKTNISSGSASWWWLRAALSVGNFRGVDYRGNSSNSSVVGRGGIALGFCLGAETETIEDSWAEIFANEANGTYSTKYSIGDTKSLDLGTEGVHLMEIVAFDTDDKADGSGKAKITWISKDLLPTTHRMNPARTANTEGTGTLGGWEKSDMRTYLNDTIKPLIPETVRNAIVPVTKVQMGYQASDETKYQQTTTDDVWIPNHREIFNATTYDQSGAVYSGKFTDANSRKKTRSGSASTWWLRAAPKSTNFSVVSGFGYDDKSSVTNMYGIALGFCT